MKEQRKNIRVPVNLNLEISDMFKQDNVKVNNINAPIEVVDISRNGIGFTSKSILPIGFYFNARLEFVSRGNGLNCVVRIIRHTQRENGVNHYGCEFVGMPTIFDYYFEEIEDEFKKVTSE